MSTRQKHLEPFAEALQGTRQARGLSQSELARHLGVSVRRLSNWEMAYDAPGANERVDIVFKLHALHPAYTKQAVEALGLLEHPGVVLLLGGRSGAARAQPASSPEELRIALDGVIREAADGADLRASHLRQGVHAVLESLAAKGWTLDQARAALAASLLRKKKESA